MTYIYTYFGLVTYLKIKVLKQPSSVVSYIWDRTNGVEYNSFIRFDDMFHFVITDQNIHMHRKYYTNHNYIAINQK